MPCMSACGKLSEERVDTSWAVFNAVWVAKLTVQGFQGALTGDSKHEAVGERGHDDVGRQRAADSEHIGRNVQ